MVCPGTGRRTQVVMLLPAFLSLLKEGPGLPRKQHLSRFSDTFCIWDNPALRAPTSMRSNSSVELSTLLPKRFYLRPWISPHDPGRGHHHSRCAVVVSQGSESGNDRPGGGRDSSWGHGWAQRLWVLWAAELFKNHGWWSVHHRNRCCSGALGVSRSGRPSWPPCPR